MKVEAQNKVIGDYLFMLIEIKLQDEERLYRRALDECKPFETLNAIRQRIKILEKELDKRRVDYSLFNG
jgi:hypothetical protein